MKKLILYLFGIIIILFVCSCKGVQYVLVETVRLDSIYINKVQRDSIYERDSIYIRDKGDTVFIEKYRYKYIDKFKRDTMYVTKVDSIQVPYPVEKKLTKWQSIKIELGGWAFGIIIAFSLIIIGWLIYKSRKK